MSWKETYRVMSHDVNMKGTFRAAAMMRYMQETAYRHMNGTGPAEEALRQEERAFLLSRIALNVTGTVRHGDSFELETWAEASSGIGFGRAFVLRTSGGEPFAEARSVWVLYDFNERRIMRISEFEHNYGSEPPYEMELPRRLTVPDGTEFLPAGEHRVSYADVDVNGHMNNTVYADVLCGEIPEICSGEARVESLYINYSNECRLGGVITIGRGGGAGDWYFRTYRDDGKHNVDARITTV